MKQLLFWLLNSVLLLPHWASADSLSIQLSSPTQLESSTAVINSALSSVHPPLQIHDWGDEFNPPLFTTPLSVGNGQHGSFNPETYLHFHDGIYNNDQIIQIDTDKFPDLQFTDFELIANWKIRPIGTRPLIIRSLSTINNYGNIDCGGAAGENADSDTLATPSGGSGTCGGANGGSGGSGTTPAVSGQAPGTNPAAGGGHGVSNGHAGAGGAGMDQTALGGSGLGVTDGAGSATAGSPAVDSAFTLVGGGGGGGGGAAYTEVSDPGAHSSGAGGGAGGGSIYLYAVGDVNIHGTVNANGGHGGAGVGSDKGGAGGGGAGGSIQIFSGSSILIEGQVSAIGGDGGISNGGNGGVGGGGRTWLVDANTTPSLGATSTLDPLALLMTWGKVDYQIGLFTSHSKIIDLENSRPVLVSAEIQALPSPGSSASIDIATGESEFALAEAVWVPFDSTSPIEVKRFIRFRLRVDNQSSSNPLAISSITLNYIKQDQTQFEFSSCQMIGVLRSSGSPGESGLKFGFLLLPLFMALCLRTRRPTNLSRS